MVGNFEELGFSATYREQVGIGAVRRIIIIVVNSHSAKPKKWEHKASPPGSLKQLAQSSGVPIERYSFDTIELMKDRAEIVSWKRRLRVAEARLAGATEEEAEAMFPKYELHIMEISFAGIHDKEERAFFEKLPTTFKLSDHEVDRLRDVAGQLLHQAPEFQALLEKYELIDSP